MNKKIRILVVDNHPIICEGLQLLLEPEEDMEVVSASDGQQALKQVAQLSPNIVLMDVKMPGLDGIECTRRIKKKFHSCRVIMLSMYDEYLAAAMEAGADGFLIKDIKRAELTQAIRDVHQGEVVISGGISAGARLEYEQRLANRSVGDELLAEVQLLMPSPIDAGQIVEFIRRVDELLQYRVVQMVGSWQNGTAITFALSKSKPLADILDELRQMPEVEEIEEKIPANGKVLGLLHKGAAMPRRTTSPLRSILITLKQGQKSKEVK